MKWVAISGSWRKTNQKLKEDVQKVVREIIKKGDGIITGGALGVDYYATEVVLEFGKVKEQLKVYLPIPIEDFCNHYYKRAKEGVITKEQAEMIVKQLKKVFKINKNIIFDNFGYTKANIESYYARNTKIVENCDIFYAFQVNDSKGTQDAINKARKLGKKVFVKKYKI